MAQELAQHDERAVTERPASAPAAVPTALLHTAIEEGADSEQIEALIRWHQQCQAFEARSAFYAAMAELAANPPRIVKNRRATHETEDGPVEYCHATLDQEAREIAQAMAAHGLSFRWRPTQDGNGRVCVECVVSHRDGHSESAGLWAMPDTSGGKNEVQSIGSVVRYLERYTLEAATGIVPEGTPDDDGRPPESVSGPDRVSQQQIDRITARLDETETDRGAFLRVFGRRMSLGALDSIDDIPASVADDAIRVIEDNAATRAKNQGS